MKTIFASLVFILLLLISQTSYAQHTIFHGRNIIKKKLTISELDSLRSYLKIKSGEAPKDTIIIKYDFKGKMCWELLDEKSNSYIDNIIQRTNEDIQQQMKERPQLSVYRFRQEGKRFNKIISRNKSIMVDDGLLKKMIIGNYTTCGTSAIIYPGGEFILLLSDSHFEALRF